MDTNDIGERIVEIDYTNWRGVRAKRLIRPLRLVWGNSSFHPEEQWLLEAIDQDKREDRTFALAGIHSWTPKGKQS